MYISKAKLFFIFVIVIFILYENIVLNNIQGIKYKYMSRRSQDEMHNLINFKNDYRAKEFAIIYLENFLKDFQVNSDAALIKYVDETYYNDVIKDNKEKYIIGLKNDLLINDIENNYYYARNISSAKRFDGRNIFVCNALVLQKGLEYPEGYHVLENIDNVDKLKSMDIQIIEEQPYTFKIVSLDKTMTGEGL